MSVPAIPVTVIVVTRNEAARIEPCLTALGAFDQVIVVDSQSDDDTQMRAAGLGAEIIDFVWNGAYPKKRQWCLDHLSCAYDWVFFVDADEILSPALIREIRALFAAGPPAPAGYFVKGRYLYQGRALRYGLYNHKIALLDRRRMMFPVIDDLDLPGMGEIEGHYQPVLKPDYQKDMIGYLRAPLYHDALDDEQRWQERHRRYAQWEAGMNRKKAWPADPVYGRQILKRLFRAMPGRPLWAFLHSYVAQGGFLDGRAGWCWARRRAGYYKMIRQVSDPR